MKTSKRIIVVLEQDHDHKKPQVAVRIDTQGFPGDTCLKEIDELSKILEGAGVKLRIDKLQMKTAQQIAAETGTSLEFGIRATQDSHEWFLEEGC